MDKVVLKDQEDHLGPEENQAHPEQLVPKDQRVKVASEDPLGLMAQLDPPVQLVQLVNKDCKEQLVKMVREEKLESADQLVQLVILEDLGPPVKEVPWDQLEQPVCRE